MNVRTERQTDRPHELHVYVGLAQARPNEPKSYVEYKYDDVIYDVMMMLFDDCINMVWVWDLNMHKYLQQAFCKFVTVTVCS